MSGVSASWAAVSFGRGLLFDLPAGGIAVDRLQTFQPPLHQFGQRLVRGNAISKDGVPEGCPVGVVRHLFRVKQ